MPDRPSDRHHRDQARTPLPSGVSLREHLQLLAAKPGAARYARRATGSVLRMLEAVLRSSIRVDGIANVPAHGPVLFVANHFTRFETFILPYLIDRYTSRNCASLAHHSLFRGRFGDYLRACGALSTHDPGIKHTIVEDLLTGRSDWLIYPEGSMVKDKKTWIAGHYALRTPDRQGPPHTGAAVLAMQAVIFRELWRHAVASGDHAAQAHWQRTFHLAGPQDVTAQDLRVVPINISYYPIRPGDNLVSRVARALFHKVPTVLAEELAVEGPLLLSETDISVYFGQPITLDHYLAVLRPRLTDICRLGGLGPAAPPEEGEDAAARSANASWSAIQSCPMGPGGAGRGGLGGVAPRSNSESRVADGKCPEGPDATRLVVDDPAFVEALGPLRARMTHRLVAEIYARLTINIDHLFCTALRQHPATAIDEDDFKRALYVAARTIQVSGNRRSHRTIAGDLVALIADKPDPHYHDVRSLAERAGILRAEHGHLHVDRAVIDAEHGFHDIRLRNTIAVIANELEPLRGAVHAVTSAVNLPAQALRRRLADVLTGEDLDEFILERESAAPATRVDEAIGKPFHLPARGGAVGVVLCHGFLAAPAEVRPFAEYLHRAGFAVYCPRLPGHGTGPERLATVRWQDWVRAIDRAWALLRCTHRHVVIGGFSTGGLLALRAAGERGDLPVGAFAVNVPMRLAAGVSRLVPAVMAWNHLLDRVHITSGHLESVENPTEHPDTNYRRTYLAGVLELERLIDDSRAWLPRVRVPTLIVQGDHDPVVDPVSGQLAFDAVGSAEKELAPMRFSRHGILSGDGSEIVHQRVAEFVRGLWGRVAT